MPVHHGETGFRVFRTVGRAFNLIFDNASTLLLIASVFALPLLVYLLAFPGPPFSRPNSVLTYIPVLLIGIVSVPIMQVAALHAARGDKIGVSAAITGGLSHVRAIFGLAIIWTILVGAGIILLIVPGLIAMTLTFVAFPACVDERLGPTESIQRSVSLTSGYRWKVFGVIMTLFFLNLIIGQVDSWVPRGGGGALAPALLQWIGGTLMAALIASLEVTTYVELIRLQEAASQVPGAPSPEPTPV